MSLLWLSLSLLWLSPLGSLHTLHTPRYPAKHLGASLSISGDKGPTYSEHCELAVLSYNIDGLNPQNLLLRTEHAMREVLRSGAQVVHLQEVVPATMPMVMRRMRGGGYCCAEDATTLVAALRQGQGQGEGQGQGLGLGLGHYFTLSFLLQNLIGIGTSTGTGPTPLPIPTFSAQRRPFTGPARGTQGRDLLLLTLSYGGLPWLLINCHLESGAAPEQAQVRGEQLQQALELLQQHASTQQQGSRVSEGGWATGPAVLANDLNLREAEAQRARKLLEKVRVGKGAVGTVAGAIAEADTGTAAVRVLDACEEVYASLTPQQQALYSRGRRFPSTWFLPRQGEASPAFSVHARFDRVYFTPEGREEATQMQMRTDCDTDTETVRSGSGSGWSVSAARFSLLGAHSIASELSRGDGGGQGLSYATPSDHRAVRAVLRLSRGAGEVGEAAGEAGGEVQAQSQAQKKATRVAKVKAQAKREVKGKGDGNASARVQKEKPPN